MSLDVARVARILGIHEPRGKYEAQIDLILDEGPQRISAPLLKPIDFGAIVYTYDCPAKGSVRIVTVDLVTTWRRHRLRLDDLPAEFQSAMFYGAHHQQEREDG